MIFQTVQSTK